MPSPHAEHPPQHRDGAWPHPESLIRAPAGRSVELKVHRARWSGHHPDNSLAAIAECYAARVARLEIDVCRLRDGDFLVMHDLSVDDHTTGAGPVSSFTQQTAGALHLLHGGRISAERPPLLSEVVALVAAQPPGPLLELDLKDSEPLPWPRVAELARSVEPIKDRIIFGGVADWNLRRLLRVDPTLPTGINPAVYLDWLPPTLPDPGAPRGAYGYLDTHPLSRQRWTSTRDYLEDRLGGILRLVPGAREVHLRLAAFEQMLADGVAVADVVHGQGLRLDVWTLDAETPRWRERLQRALAAGVDMITTNTAPQLAQAAGPGSQPGT